MILGLMLALSFPAMVHALAVLDIVVTAPLLGGAVPGSSLRRAIPPARSAQADARSRESAWTPMTIAFAAFVLAVVAWPVTTALYDVPPGPAFIVAVAAAIAPPLAVRWPWAGLSLSVVAVAAMMLVTIPAQASAPWPWPVTSLLAHCLALLVLAVFAPVVLERLRLVGRRDPHSGRPAAQRCLGSARRGPARDDDQRGGASRGQRRGGGRWAPRCGSGRWSAPRSSGRNRSAPWRCAAGTSSRSGAGSRASRTTWSPTRCL
ncbi:hypothetical protein [Brachybacterium sp. GPGPB12]|uniref:hypothetical protein n=1 Tax=Brachybacterium sp. GPGPB12 TaxID=3023517 RepID=UPI0031342B65